MLLLMLKKKHNLIVKCYFIFLKTKEKRSLKYDFKNMLEIHSNTVLEIKIIEILKNNFFIKCIKNIKIFANYYFDVQSNIFSTLS